MRHADDNKKKVITKRINVDIRKTEEFSFNHVATIYNICREYNEEIKSIRSDLHFTLDSLNDTISFPKVLFSDTLTPKGSLLEERLKNKKEEVILSFHSERTMIVLVLDLSPSMFRFDSSSENLYIQNMENSLNFLLRSACNSGSPHFEQVTYISVYSFGHLITEADETQEAIMLIDKLLLTKSNITDIFNLLCKEIRNFYCEAEEIHEKRQKVLQQSVSHLKRNQSSSKYSSSQNPKISTGAQDSQSNEYMTLNQALESIFPKLQVGRLHYKAFKFMVLTNGISLSHNMSLANRAQIGQGQKEFFLNRMKYYGFSTSFILMGSSQLNHQSEYGFILSTDALERFASKFNGRIIFYEKLSEIIQQELSIRNPNEEMPSLVNFKKYLKAIEYKIDIKSLKKFLAKSSSSIFQSKDNDLINREIDWVSSKLFTIRKDQEILKGNYEISIMKIEEVCNVRLQEGWLLKYSNDPQITYCFKYQYDNGLNILYTIQKLKALKEFNQYRIKMFLKMPSNFSLSKKSGDSYMKNVDSFIEKIKEEDNFLSSLDFLLLNKTGGQATTIEANMEKIQYLSRINDYSVIFEWEKIFKVKTLCILFLKMGNKFKSKVQTQSESYISRFQNLIEEFCQLRISRTLFVKSLDENSNRSGPEVLKFCTSFLIIKLIWKSRQILEIKLAFRNISYERAKEICSNFKKMICDERINSFKVVTFPSSLLNYLSFNRKNSTIEEMKNSGVAVFREWEWGQDKIPNLNPFLKTLCYIRKSSNFLCLKSGENNERDHLVFVKKFPMRNDEEGKLQEKHTSFIIYSLRRKDKGTISVRVRMAMRNVISAYYCIQHKFMCKKPSLLNYEKIYESIISDILNEEILCIQQIYTAHLLHKCTMQWKLNNTNIDDHIANVVVRDLDTNEFKEIQNSASALSNSSSILTPGNILELFKKTLQHWLKRDYLYFDDDPKKVKGKNEKFIDFQRILNNAYHLKRERINYIEFADPNHEMVNESSQESDINPHEESKKKSFEEKPSTPSETIREKIKKMNDLIEDYKIVLKNIMDLDINVNYSEFINKSLNINCFLYSKFIDHRMILLVVFPTCPSDELFMLNKNARTNSYLEYYMMDVEACESNKPTEEKFLARSEGILDNIFTSINTNLKKAFCRNIHKCCKADLMVRELDLKEAVSNCKTEKFKIDISELLNIIEKYSHFGIQSRKTKKLATSQIHRNSTTLDPKSLRSVKTADFSNRTRNKGEPDTGKKSSPGPKIDSLEFIEEEDASGVLEHGRRTSKKSKTQILQEYPILNESNINRIFSKIVEYFYKRIPRTNLFVETKKCTDNQQSKLLKNEEEYITEYLSYLRRTSVTDTKQSAPDDIHFLSMKLENKVSLGNHQKEVTNLADFTEFTKAIRFSVEERSVLYKKISRDIETQKERLSKIRESVSLKEKDHLIKDIPSEKENSLSLEKSFSQEKSFSGEKDFYNSSKEKLNFNSNLIIEIHQFQEEDDGNSPTKEVKKGASNSIRVSTSQENLFKIGRTNNPKINDIISLTEALISQTILEYMRFETPLISEDLTKVNNLFQSLTASQRASMTYKINLIDEKQIEVFHEELVSENTRSHILLEKIGIYYCLIHKPDETNSNNFFFLPDLKLDEKNKSNFFLRQRSNTYVIPFWVFFTIRDNLIELKLHLPLYRSTPRINKTTILDKMNSIFEETVKRSNTRILIKELKENLMWPSQLFIKESAVKQTPDNDESISNLSRPTVTKRGKGFPSRIVQGGANKPSELNTSNLNKESQSTMSSFVSQTMERPPKSNPMYEVPLVHKEYIPIYDKLKKSECLSLLIKYGPSLSNFQVFNLNNTFVLSLGKDIYIISLEEKDNPFTNSSPNELGVDKISNGLINSRRVLLFEIYSMKKIDLETVDYFKQLINDSLIPGIIQLLNSIFIKHDQVKVPREDFEYLYNAPTRKILRYPVPDFIIDLNVFLNFLRQNLCQILFPFTVKDANPKKSVMGKGSLINSEPRNSDNGQADMFDLENEYSEPAEDIIKCKLMGNIDVYKVDYQEDHFSYLYNNLKAINQTSLGYFFGKCIFICMTQIRLKMEDEKDFSGDTMRSFNSYIPENISFRPNIKEDGNPIKQNLFMEFISLKGYPGVNTRTKIVNSWSYVNSYIFDKSTERFFGKPIIRNCNLEKGFLNCHEVQTGIEPKGPSSSDKGLIMKKNATKLRSFSDVYLDFDIHIQGSLMEEKFIAYITEILNQVALEYSIEVLFQKRMISDEQDTKSNKSLKEMLYDRNSSLKLFLEGVDHIFSLLEHRSLSLTTLEIKNHFLLQNYMELFQNVIVLLVKEISALIGRENDVKAIPIIYMLEDKYLQFKSQKKNTVVDSDLKRISEIFEQVYVENPKNEILMEPTLTGFLASNIFYSYFDESFNGPASRDEEYKIPSEHSKKANNKNQAEKKNKNDKKQSKKKEGKEKDNEIKKVEENNEAKPPEKDLKTWTDVESEKIRNFEPIVIKNSSISRPFRIPRNFMIKVTLSHKNLEIDFYNINKNIIRNMSNHLKEIEVWSSQRASIFKHVILQKLGIYNYHYPLETINYMQTKAKDSFISDLNTFSNEAKAIPVSKNSTAFTRGHMKPYGGTVKEIPRKLSGDRHSSQELSTKEKLTLTKRIISRIESPFPSILKKDEANLEEQKNETRQEEEEFKIAYQKFTEVSFKIIRPKSTKAKKNMGLKHQKWDLIRGYCFHFTDLAKEYYLTRLRKAQLDYLVSLNIKEADQKLLKRIVKNFVAKEDIVRKTNMKFFFFQCFDDIDRIRETLDSPLNFVPSDQFPISDIVGDSEKLEEDQQRQNQHIMYKILTSTFFCLIRISTNIGYEQLFVDDTDTRNQKSEYEAVFEMMSGKSSENSSMLNLPDDNLSFDEGKMPENRSSIPEMFHIFSRAMMGKPLPKAKHRKFTSCVLKKIKKNVIFIHNIIMAPPDFSINTFYKALSPCSNEHIKDVLKEEIDLLNKDCDLDRVIYEVHLDYLFELATSEDQGSSFLKINYFSVLSLLTKQFKNKIPQVDKHLSGFVLKINPGFVFSSIKSKDFTSFLKENAEDYNFSKLEYGRFCHLHFKNEEITLSSRSSNKFFFILFDIVDKEDEQKNYDSLEEFSISLDKNSTSGMEEIRIVYFILLKLEEPDSNCEHVISELNEIIMNLFQKKFQTLKRNLVAQSSLRRIVMSHEGFSYSEIDIMMANSSLTTFSTLDKTFQTDIRKMLIFNQEFLKFLKKLHPSTRFSIRNIEVINEDFRVLIPDEQQRSAILLQISSEFQIQDIYLIDVKSRDDEWENIKQKIQQILLSWIWAFNTN